MEDEGALGPVSYLIVEFSPARATGEAFQRLVELVDQGLVRVLDLVFAVREADGSLRQVALAELDPDGRLDLAVFDGAASGLLDQSDLDGAREAVSPGSAAAVLLFEHCWARQFVGAVRRGGGELVGAGFVPHDRLIAALDARDAGNGAAGSAADG